MEKKTIFVPERSEHDSYIRENRISILRLTLFPNSPFTEKIDVCMGVATAAGLKGIRINIRRSAPFWLE